MHSRHVSKLTLRILIITAALSFETFGYFPDPLFLPFADSLFALQSDTQVTALRTKKEERTYFMVTTCKTMNLPFSAITGKLQNVDAYPDYFSFITKVVDVNEGDGPVKMLVGAYGLYRIYFFGKIRSEFQPDSTRYRVICGDVEQKKYRKAWRKRVRGMIKIGSHSTDIFWTVEKRGEASCRVSLTASQAFTARTPNWMVSIGTNKIFKGMLRDLEKYLLTNGPTAAQETAPAPSPAPVVPAAQPSSDQAAPAQETPAAEGATTQPPAAVPQTETMPTAPGN